MKPMPNKMTRPLLIFLLTVSLMWNLIYELVNINVKTAKIIFSNPVTDNIWLIYHGGLPSLPSILVSFINVVYALIGLHKTYKTKDFKRKYFVGWLLYVIVSLGVLVLNCITLKGIFEGLIAG